MPMPPFTSDTVHAIICAGSVTGASGVAPIAGGGSPTMRGIAPSTGAAGQSIVRLGAGSYTIQLPGGEPSTVGSIHITPIGAAGTIQFHVVSWSAAGLITIESVLGSSVGPIVPTDSDFIFAVYRNTGV
jgi:hypothetical protein